MRPCRAFLTFPPTFSTNNQQLNSITQDLEVFNSEPNSADDFSDLINSTFLGGIGDVNIRDIEVDDTGAVYIVGDTGASDFPTTANVYNTTYNGGSRDIFVSKLS